MHTVVESTFDIIWIMHIWSMLVHGLYLRPLMSKL